MKLLAKTTNKRIWECTSKAMHPPNKQIKKIKPKLYTTQRKTSVYSHISLWKIDSSTSNIQTQTLLLHICNLTHSSCETPECMHCIRHHMVLLNELSHNSLLFLFLYGSLPILLLLLHKQRRSEAARVSTLTHAQIGLQL